MKSHHLCLCLVLVFMGSAVNAAEKDVIPAALAAGRAGEKATVEFLVEAGRLLSDRDDPICFLNSLKSFWSKENFTIVMFSETLERFQKAGISDPVTHFKGKTIQVRGVIGIRQGKAQIIVEYVGQIEVIEKE